jgi:hypothetical protein
MKKHISYLTFMMSAITLNCLSVQAGPVHPNPDVLCSEQVQSAAQEAFAPGSGNVRCNIDSATSISRKSYEVTCSDENNDQATYLIKVGGFEEDTGCLNLDLKLADPLHGDENQVRETNVVQGKQALITASKDDGDEDCPAHLPSNASCENFRWGTGCSWKDSSGHDHSCKQYAEGI